MGRDDLNREAVLRELNGRVPNIDLLVYDEVTSTNTVLKEMAREGAPEWRVVLANRQSGGRGRKGRVFVSPGDTGIYVSMLIKPDLPPERASFLTTAAAVSVCESVNRICKVECGIKWVNDVFCNDRKICGILTESDTCYETGALNWVIVGIGVNILPPTEKIPDELSNIFSTVYQETPDYPVRNQLAAEVIASMAKYASGSPEDYLQYYRKHCFILGREVQIITGDKVRFAKALDVDENIHLHVQYTDTGETDELFAGEVSIRL